MTATSPDTRIDDRAAWGLAEVLARQALYRARVLAHREHQPLRLPVSVDLARAVLVWLVWDQSRGRAHHAHPGTRIRAAVWPTVVPAHACAYQRALLEPLLDADPEAREAVAMAVRMIAVADWTLIDQRGDHPGDGEPRASVDVTGMSLTGQDGGVERVACPVCGCSTRLHLAWDGYAASASCPDGHGEWGTGIGSSEWAQIWAMS